MEHQINGIALPNELGFFGNFGGQFIPPHLKEAMDEINNAYEEIRHTAEFQDELNDLFKNYVGRPSPLFYAKRLSDQLGGAQIYLKREDLNHTGAHKINHCLGEALLAKYMGKSKVIAETGAGQHGVALATACALVGIPCEIHMGQVDIEKEHPNVVKMKILGAKLVSVTQGTATLKDAVDSAFEEYLKDPKNYIYAIGSVVGPHPFPKMVRDFQSIIGNEIKTQANERFGQNPDYVVACVGGGSNAAGTFFHYLDEPSVRIISAEAAGHGVESGMSAATTFLGRPGILHGSKSLLMQTVDGQVVEPHSISAGLDYPGIGPLHAHLWESKRAEFFAITDEEALKAGFELAKLEGIIPAIETSHALAVLPYLHALPEETVVIGLSGRGDKDLSTYMKFL